MHEHIQPILLHKHQNNRHRVGNMAQIFIFLVKGKKIKIL